MDNRTCLVAGCDRSPVARGWCGKHYQRWKRLGDPEAGTDLTKYKTPEESFAARTRWEGDCLIWTGTKSSLGYGYIGVGQRNTYPAHRWAWEREHGKLPSHIYVDHRCHNPSCVNIAHLRPGPQKLNIENRQGANKGSVSKYRGVNWDKQTSKWRAKVTHNGITKSLGRFNTEEEAAEAARAARIKLFKFNDLDHPGFGEETSPTSGECGTSGQER